MELKTLCIAYFLYRWLKRFRGTLTDGRSCLIGQIPAKRCLPQVLSRDIVAGLFPNTMCIASSSAEVDKPAYRTVNTLTLTHHSLHHRYRPVIFLNWTGVDPSSNPLHPASKLFASRSSTELQCIYILYLENLGIIMRCKRKRRCKTTRQKLPILRLTNNLSLVVNLNSRILLI